MAFNIHVTIAMLGDLVHNMCSSCQEATCRIKGGKDKHPECLCNLAREQIDEFYINVKGGFKEYKGRFLQEVFKPAMDGKTSLLFDAGDEFIVKGEYSENQYLCKEVGPGGKEFKLTKRTEGTVWIRLF